MAIKTVGQKAPVPNPLNRAESTDSDPGCSCSSNSGFHLREQLRDALYDAEHFAGLARWIENARGLVDKLSLASEHDEQAAAFLEKWGIVPGLACWDDFESDSLKTLYFHIETLTRAACEQLDRAPMTEVA